MPDLRYHLISLISVFLALAIGILLGVAMADRGVVSERVRAEITSIQHQLDKQQRQISKQDDQIAEQEVMLQRMSDTLISDSLQGEDVALVAGPYANSDVFGAVQGDLSKAGANITTVETLDLPNPAEITGQELTTHEATTQLESGYAVDFAHSILGYTQPERNTPGVVIFVGGGEIPEDAPPGTLNALKGVERKMFQIWLNAGVRVVGAQPSDAKRNEIPLFQNVGIPSVDNADQPAGRAAIIECAAMQDCEGTYGTRNSASDPFPSPS